MVSHQVGVRKPGRAIYEHCRKLAGCRPEEMLFIDDLPGNVEAARACGWRGIVYQPTVDVRRLLCDAGVRLAA